MSKDQFADLLSGLTKKKDDTKLSLAERQRSNTPGLPANNNNGGWANFDLLDKSSSKPMTPSSASNGFFEGFDVLNSSKPAQTPQSFQQQQPVIQQPQPIAQEHLFEGFSSRTPTPQLTQKTQSSNTSNFDLLDDFGFGASTTQTATPLNSMSQPTPPPQQETQSLDDLFAVFDAPPKPTQTPVATPQTQPATPAQPQQAQPGSRPQSRAAIPANDDAYDEAVASIVDMGFSAEQAVEALGHTESGVDVQAAINHIMTAAHNKSRANAGLPPHAARPSSSRPSSSSPNAGLVPDEYIQGFSKLMSGVTKKVMAAQKQFMQPPPSRDGRPAWMRDAEKYKRRGPLFDEDPDVISSEELNKLHLEERPQPPRPRKNSTNQPPSRPHRPAHASAPTPPQRQRQPEPEPEVDLFAPLPTKADEPIVDLFSSPAPQKPFSNDEMMSSSKRRSARSTPPSRTSTQTPKSTRPSVHISSTQMEFFKDSREHGGVAFKNGDFTTALQHYETALSSLPEGHVYQILSMSNLITCYLKVGENRKAVDMSTRALTLIGDGKGAGEEIDGKSMKEFWVKIMSKRAEAQEHLEKHKDALDTWMSVIESGGANKQALDAKRRLQDMLNPKPVATTPKPQAKPAAAPKKPTAQEPAKTYEAVDRLKKENKAQEKFEAEKYQLLDVVEAKINAWKNGKENNLRALLSSLDTVLWPDLQWKNVGMSDLVVPKKVKISYMKAVAKTHPDKVPKDATSEQKMVAQSVFVTLNTAWDDFKSHNGLN